MNERAGPFTGWAGLPTATTCSGHVPCRGPVASPGNVVGGVGGVVVGPPFRAFGRHEEVQARTVRENERMATIRTGRTTADPWGLGAPPGREIGSRRKGS